MVNKAESISSLMTSIQKQMKSASNLNLIPFNLMSGGLMGSFTRENVLELMQKPINELIVLVTEFNDDLKPMNLNIDNILLGVWNIKETIDSLPTQNITEHQARLKIIDCNEKLSNYESSFNEIKSKLN